MNALILEYVKMHCSGVVIFTVSVLLLFIDFTPKIKWNPIRSFFAFIGRLLNRETQATLLKMKFDMDENNNKSIKTFMEVEENMKAMNVDFNKKLEDLKSSVDIEKVKCKRWEILDFANSCKNGRPHSCDEFTHIFDIHTDYENLIEKYDLDNGVVTVEYKYLLDLYLKKCETNDFL